MTKKKYACRECGFIFPIELGELIDNKIQVFCEKCGTAFTLKGVVFKPYSEIKKEDASTLKSQPIDPNANTWQSGFRTGPLKQYKYRSYSSFSDRQRNNMEKLIKVLNGITFPFLIFIPIIFASFIATEVVYFVSGATDYLNQFIIYRYILFMIAGFIIIIYYKKRISKKVKNKQYNEIALDALCWGIVSCIFFGLGAPLVVEGAFILLYNLYHKKNFAHNLKNSINHFSVKAGILLLFIIFAFLIGLVVEIREGISGIEILMTFDEELIERFLLVDFIPWGIFFGLLIISFIIDTGYRKSLAKRDKIKFGDATLIFVIGILGTMFFAAGIFILLKGVLLVLMFIVRPKKTEEKEIVSQQKPQSIPEEGRISKDQKSDEGDAKELQKQSEKDFSLSKKKKKEIKVHVKKTEKLKKELDKETTLDKEYKLKIHESLLPVSDEKDKELVKQYFSKIFAVLSKDAREQINKLKISKKEKKELLEELAFLTQEEQAKYLETIITAYQEIPKKLTDRIRKLPNIKASHINKIVNQLKYLDYEEQIKFVQYLEENA